MSPALLLGALGVVFGDIGTSPLYAFSAACKFLDADNFETSVLGISSLFFWALILVVTVKYLGFVMRADNHGEGGVFALLAQLRPYIKKKGGTPVIMLIILFGAALLLGDGVITPAISVLSAVEGLEFVTPELHRFIVPISILILAVLFLVQRFGTGSIGVLFGPVMLVWFVTLGALGAWQLFEHGLDVLQAANPWFAAKFLVTHPGIAIFVIGAVVLCVTGAEALFADMGHFGRLPIVMAWYFVALPGLVLNYFGQAAMVLARGKAPENSFYALVPDGWPTLMLTILATLATIVASQALISGSFALVRQGIQLHLLPPLKIIHTSRQHEQQIFIPLVNTCLGVACIFTVLMFRSADNLAAAYGLADTGAMMVTSIAYFVVRRKRMKKGIVSSVALLALFLTVDFLFFSANLLKLLSGGYYPLAIAGAVFFVMVTYYLGRLALHDYHTTQRAPLKSFLEDLKPEDYQRMPGTAVFLTGNNLIMPIPLANQLRLYQVLRERNVMLTMAPESVPRVLGKSTTETVPLAHGFVRVTASYGYEEQPDLDAILKEAEERLFEGALPRPVVYFVARERIIPSKDSPLPMFQEKLFAFLHRNARPIYEYFHWKSDDFIETIYAVRLGEKVDQPEHFPPKR
ncbi:MAG: KUP/HAK/KT family potassium transporter [Verrucomicrobiota bacterium]